MSNVGDVRQILMNELGLTRAAVREEMERIVRETVERRVNAMFAEGTFDRIISQAVSVAAQGDPPSAWMGRPSLRAMAEHAIAKRVNEVVREQITFRVEVPAGAAGRQT